MIRSDRSSSDLFTTQNSNCLITLYVLAENVKINCKIKHKMYQFYLKQFYLRIIRITGKSILLLFKHILTILNIKFLYSLLLPLFFLYFLVNTTFITPVKKMNLIKICFDNTCYMVLIFCVILLKKILIIKRNHWTNQQLRRFPLTWLYFTIKSKDFYSLGFK